MIRCAVELTALAIVRQRRTVTGESVEECIEKAKQTMNNEVWHYQGLSDQDEVKVEARALGQA